MCGVQQDSKQVQGMSITSNTMQISSLIALRIHTFCLNRNALYYKSNGILKSTNDQRILFVFLSCINQLLIEHDNVEGRNKKTYSSFQFFLLINKLKVENSGRMCMYYDVEQKQLSQWCGISIVMVRAKYICMYFL